MGARTAQALELLRRDTHAEPQLTEISAASVAVSSYRGFPLVVVVTSNPFPASGGARLPERVGRDAPGDRLRVSIERARIGRFNRPKADIFTLRLLTEPDLKF